MATKKKETSAWGVFSKEGTLVLVVMSRSEARDNRASDETIAKVKVTLAK